jgi:ABC-type nitrate/sulfonate/bicarbonate transport system substrate-binding protein
MIRRACAVVLGLTLASAALAQAPEPLRVKVFPGAQNVALWTGLARGTFLKHGVAVDLQFTQTSPELRDGLASGPSTSRTRRPTTRSRWSRSRSTTS